MLIGSENQHLTRRASQLSAFCLHWIVPSVNVPTIPMYADEYICGQELWVGDMPKIGENFICCVSLEGFPFQSYPNILEILEHLPIAYRWSNRMIMLDQHESVDELMKKRRKWRQKQRGFLSQVFKVNGGMVNEDAVADVERN